MPWPRSAAVARRAAVRVLDRHRARSTCGTTWSRRRATARGRTSTGLRASGRVTTGTRTGVESAPRDGRPAGRGVSTATQLRRWASPDVSWDEVVAIEPMRRGSGLSTSPCPSTHNFVAADVSRAQHRVRARDGDARGDDGEEAGALLLARDGSRRADPAHPVQRGAGRLAEAAQRPARRQRLDARSAEAIDRLEVPLYLDDNPRVTVMEIRAKARRMKARNGGLALIVIDYLQLMSGGDNAENRQLEVSEISRGLKILARELEVPIVALSQLSRNLESPRRQAPDARRPARERLPHRRHPSCARRHRRGGRRSASSWSGATDVPIWSLDERYRLVRGPLLRAFPSGVKPTYRLRWRRVGRSTPAPTTRSCTVGGWRPVEALVRRRSPRCRRAPRAARRSPTTCPWPIWAARAHEVGPRRRPVDGRRSADVLGPGYCGATLTGSA